MEYISLIADCLRFDRGKFKVSFKKEIAALYLKFMKNDQPSADDELSPIKAVFRHVLGYCLSSPTT